ncbi:uncharacterized protein [Triticum aestivum]|uniref:uncharacterized protein isoform X3 n=1 Tax=Triticum aestivum TaxID=4565 RepID=UPI001D005049|nr:uncharacterized protein LOC123071361 isoform X3 [Triticum aestivum]
MARVSGIYSGAGGQVALLSSDVEGGTVDSLPAARDEVAMELPPPPLASGEFVRRDPSNGQRDDLESRTGPGHASCRYGTVKIEDLVWSRKNCNTLDSKDTWMIIWVCGKYTAMMMMFRFIMMMMDAFSLRQLVHKECASFYRDSWYTWRLHQW